MQYTLLSGYFCHPLPGLDWISCTASISYAGTIQCRERTSGMGPQLAMFQSRKMMAGSCDCNQSKYLASGHAILKIHAEVGRQPLHARRAQRSRRNRRPVPPSAMLGMFQRKEKTEIVRCGAPVLRKVSRSILSAGVSHYIDAACTMLCCLAWLNQLLSHSGHAQVAEKVPDEMFGTEELRELVAKMVTAMREAPGVGLAAPQIGISLQVRPCAYLCVLASLSPHHGQCTPPHAAN